MLQYSVRENFVATSIEPDATGALEAIVRQDEKVNFQRLRLMVARLKPRSSYTLRVQPGDGADFVTVTNFATTTSGRGYVLYLENRVANGRGLARATKRPLPKAINPLTHARAIAIANAQGEFVLTASLHESPSMNFEMATVLENTGNDLQAVGCLAVACQNGGVQFRLFATGQTSEFTLYVNESPVAVYPADDTGRINVGVFPSPVPSPVTFEKLSLRNAAGAVVLESIVP